MSTTADDASMAWFSGTHDGDCIYRDVGFGYNKVMTPGTWMCGYDALTARVYAAVPPDPNLRTSGINSTTTGDPRQINWTYEILPPPVDGTIMCATEKVDAWWYCNAETEVCDPSKSGFCMSKVESPLKGLEDADAAQVVASMIGGVTTSVTPSAAPADEGMSRNKLSTGAIAGVVVGVVVLAAILFGVALFLLRRRKARRCSRGPKKLLKVESLDPYKSTVHELPPASEKKRPIELPAARVIPS